MHKKHSCKTKHIEKWGLSAELATLLDIGKLTIEQTDRIITSHNNGVKGMKYSTEQVKNSNRSDSSRRHSRDNSSQINTNFDRTSSSSQDSSSRHSRDVSVDEHSIDLTRREKRFNESSNR